MCIKVVQLSEKMLQFQYNHATDEGDPCRSMNSSLPSTPLVYSIQPQSFNHNSTSMYLSSVFFLQKEIKIGIAQAIPYLMFFKRS